MYKISIQHLRVTGRRTTLLMTHEAASQMSINDVLTLDDDNTPDWRVLDIDHAPMTLGGLKILKNNLENLATIRGHHCTRDVEKWNYVVVCQELELAEKELLG